MMLEARILHQLGAFRLDVELRTVGPVLGVFGASGSGKTTVLHALAGFLRPDQARIVALGRELCVLPGGSWLPPELLALADDCIVLEAGRVVEQGAPVDVLQRPRALAVANLVGIDNLLRLEVLAHDEVGGATWLGLGPLKLAGPLCEAAVGSVVSVGFYADDVLLALERPAGISARNAIPCEVSALHTLGHDVVADLRIGPNTVRAPQTPGAVGGRGQQNGGAGVALVKTAAIHLLG